MRKWKIATLVIGLSVGLAGCSSVTWEDLDAMLINPRDAITEVGLRNQQVVDEYARLGLLSTSQQATIKNAIQQKVTSITGSASDFQNIIDSSIVSTYSAGSGESTSFDTSLLSPKGTSAVALDFMDDGFYQSFLSNINKKVYVLNPDLTQDEFAQCVEASQLALKNPTDSATIQKLTSSETKYFIDSGKTLRNFTEKDLFKVSETSEGTAVGKESPTNAINKDLGVQGYVTGSDGAKKKKVLFTVRIREFNKDFVDTISSSKNTKDKYFVPQVKSDASGNTVSDNMNVIFLMEYPVKVLDNINLGENDNRSTDLGGNKWYAHFTDSKLRVNLVSGEMLYNGRVVNKETKEEDKVYRVTGSNPSFSFLQDKGTKVPIEEIVNNIILGNRVDGTTVDTNFGTTIKSEDIEVGLLDKVEDKWVYTYEENDYYCSSPYSGTEVNSATVVLTDYLELTYMPGGAVNLPNEPFIATGRRISLTKLSGEATLGAQTSIGIYCDKLGNPIADINNNAQSVTLGDLIDYSSGQGYYTDVAEKLGVGGLTNEASVQEELNKGTDSRQSKLTDVLKVDSNNSAQTGSDGMLKDKSVLGGTAFFTWIRPQLKFGSGVDKDSDRPSLAGEDTGVDSQAFWGLCLSSDAFKTTLFTGWVTVQGNGGDVGSLTWWNSWLSGHGFQYHIDMEALAKLLEKVYSVAISEKDNTTIFNMDTLNTVNKLMTEDSKERTERTQLTFFTIFGGLLFPYGILLLIAWTLDVNMINGPEILHKLTWKHLHAIRDSSELPLYNEKGEYWVTGGQLAVIIIGLWLAGSILIVFDLWGLWETVKELLLGLTAELRKYYESSL